MKYISTSSITVFYAPHKLYLVTSSPMVENEHGDPLTGTEETSYIFLCDCFLHDVDTWMKRGYAGVGITVKYYVNIDRRDDLAIGQEVFVYEQDGVTFRGGGKIVDIKKTGGMQFGGIGEYMTIYI